MILGFVPGLQYVTNVTIRSISQSLGTGVGPLREWPLRTRGNNADKNRGSPEKNRDYTGKLGY